MLLVHEMLTNFMATTILPRFRKERIDNYKKIMNQFSKMERMNSKNVIIMWQSIMHFHSEKSASIESEIGTRANSAMPPQD